MATDPTPSEAFEPGDAVEVFNTYRQAWVAGFEVAHTRSGRYALRRKSDWAVLPGTFAAAVLRPPATGLRRRP
jgi:hypothetical protein